MVPGTTAFSHPDRYRSLSWVEEFFSGCLECRFQSSFCWRFSGTRHQSPNQTPLLIRNDARMSASEIQRKTIVAKTKTLHDLFHDTLKDIYFVQPG
jgi:hypothetical protein